MARPMTETTKSIIAVLEKNKEITYNEAVDQGLIDPAVITVARFNVTKHNFTKGKIVAISGAKPKSRKRKAAKVPAVPKASTNGRKGRQTYRQYKGGAATPVHTLVNVPDMTDLTAAMKLVSDAGGLAKAKELIARATTLQGAVSAVENAAASLAKIA